MKQQQRVTWRTTEVFFHSTRCTLHLSSMAWVPLPGAPKICVKIKSARVLRSLSRTFKKVRQWLLHRLIRNPRQKRCLHYHTCTAYTWTPYNCTAFMYDSVNIHRTCTAYICDVRRTCTPYTYAVHVRWMSTLSHMYAVHVRRTFRPWMYGRDLILLWPRPIFHGCHGGQTGNVSCCIHYNNPTTTSTSWS